MLACFCIFAFSAYAQGYYAEGTHWTELRLDTLKYDSWFTEVNGDGAVRYVPNYDITDFYIKGDTSHNDELYFYNNSN